MRPNEDMSGVVAGRLYRVSTSTLLARNISEDEFLYRTARGNYFIVYMRVWDGLSDYIEPVGEDGAFDFWRDAENFRLVASFGAAFPDMKGVEEA